MTKLISFLTFALVLGGVVFGVLSLPETSTLAARAGDAANCPMHEVALDEGYGISRMAMQRVCAGE